MNLYPNPSKDIIHINYSKDYLIKSVEVYTILGQLVQSYTNTKILDINTLKKGIYFVKIKNLNNKEVIRKIVKD